MDWLSKCFILTLYLSTVKSNMLYQRRTDLDYRQQDTALSFPVASLSVCAKQCTEMVQCVSFFFNPLEFLCQTEGRIVLSFDGSDAGPWQYYGLYYFYFLDKLYSTNLAYPFFKFSWSETILNYSNAVFLVRTGWVHIHVYKLFFNGLYFA
jgi:hypothetical protein